MHHACFVPLVALVLCGAFAVRRDTIGLPNLGLSTFKIKNGNNGNIGGEWRLKWTGMTSAAAVARPGESVTVSCFYTGECSGLPRWKWGRGC